MEHNVDKLRMNYPIELRAAGIELSLTMLAQCRYGLHFNQSDLNHRKTPIGVLAMSGEQSSQAQVEATATHDGCFSIVVSVGACAFDVGLLFGQNYKWIQLHSLEIIRADKIYKEDESLFTTDVMSTMKCENAVEMSDGLLNFVDKNGFIFLSPREYQEGEHHFVYRVVFRPLVAQ